MALEVHREARITSLSKEGPGDGGPVRLPEKYWRGSGSERKSGSEYSGTPCGEIEPGTEIRAG